jgi:hypothetical protein
MQTVFWRARVDAELTASNDIPPLTTVNCMGGWGWGVGAGVGVGGGWWGGARPPAGRGRRLACRSRPCVWLRAPAASEPAPALSTLGKPLLA